MFFLALFVLISIAAAAPTPSKRCDALAEDIPWTVSNLTAFEAAAGTEGNSYVTFHFCDVNSGLQLDTWCNRPVAAGQSVIDPNNYYPCDGNQVRFIYGGDSLTLERSYTDDCLGPPPYNGAIAGGSAATNIVNTTSPAGNTCTQDVLIVKITEEW